MHLPLLAVLLLVTSATAAPHATGERPAFPTAATCMDVNPWRGWCDVRAGLTEAQVRDEHARVCDDMRAVVGVADSAVGVGLGRAVWREFEDWLCRWPTRFLK